MDTNQWPQGGIGGVKPIHHHHHQIESVVVPKLAAATSASGGGGATESGRKARPAKEAALNCPRCNSTNTKFCYYNNYSLTQPRYFCKTCRRYWTEGGTLRNVPVGGGSRKNKRPSSLTSFSSITSSSSSSAALKKLPADLMSFSRQNPNGGHDLNLAYPSSSGLTHLPSLQNPTNGIINHISSSPLEGLISMPNFSAATTPSLFYPATSVLLPLQMQEEDNINYKPTKLNFCLQDGFENDDQNGNNNARGLFLPYEDLKPLSSTQYDDHHHHQQQQQQNRGGGGRGESNNGYYWNNSGMLGGSGGASW